MISMGYTPLIVKLIHTDIVKRNICNDFVGLQCFFDPPIDDHPILGYCIHKWNELNGINEYIICSLMAKVGLNMKIKSHDSYKYVEVFKITAFKDGAIFKTEMIGFALTSRPKKEGEVYTSISTSLTSQKGFEIELII